MIRRTACRLWLLRRGTRSSRGSAAVELAITLPLLVAFLFGAVDFGRAFYAYVSVSSAAHEAAVYTARYQDAPAAQTLATVIAGESSGFLAVRLTPAATSTGNTTLSGPSVVPGDAVDMARVQLTYSFRPVVPIPFAGPISVSAAAAAPLTSVSDGSALPPTATPVPSTATPTASATSTTAPATSTPTAGATATSAPASATPTRTPTAAPTLTATATQVVTCTVPNFVGIHPSSAGPLWTGAGFTGAFNASGTGNPPIQSQSLPAGSQQPCTSSITVTW